MTTNRRVWITGPLTTRRAALDTTIAVNEGTDMTNNSKRQPADRTRALAAVDLRTTGASYRAIAEQLGYRDASGAYRAVARLLTRREAESVGELRAVESQRLDEMQAGLWPKAKAGDLGAVREVIRIMERRARLFGVDAPVSVTVAAVSEAEFQERARELLEVVGDGPLRELAQLPARAEPVVSVGTREWAALGWSNLGVESDGSATVFTDDDEPVVTVSRRVDDDESVVVEEVVEIVAELVEDTPIEHNPCGCGGPRPPGQRRIPRDDVLDANGVPFSRAGMRLGGYRPLAGWRP